MIAPLSQLREACGLFCDVKVLPNDYRHVSVVHNGVKADFVVGSEGVEAAQAWIKALHYVNDTTYLGQTIPCERFTSYSFQDSAYSGSVFSTDIRPPLLAAYKFAGQMSNIGVSELQYAALQKAGQEHQQFAVLAPDHTVMARVRLIHHSVSSGVGGGAGVWCTLDFEGEGYPDP